MIPPGAPPFITLVLVAGMIAVTTAQITYLHNRGILGRPMFQRCPSFTNFHYHIVTILLYLIAQILTFLKIMIPTESLDVWIMRLLFTGTGAILSFVFWAYRFRVGEKTRTPMTVAEEEELKMKAAILEELHQSQEKHLGALNAIVGELRQSSSSDKPS